MKIVFKDSELNEGIINVSFDGGFTFTDYEIADVKESGILLDDSQDYEKIKIKGPANVLKNLDVLSSINTLYESNLLPEDITGLVLKEFNGEFDRSLLQKYPNLTNVTIPDSVTSISYQAFYYCSSLTSINIPSSVTKIDGYAFAGCKSLTSVTIPNSVTSISNYAFYNCTNLTNVTIQEGVITIGYYTFARCTSLTSVTIPNSVTSIGKSAFGSCKSLTSIGIDENNQNYSTSEDEKVLFNKNKTTLICYPSANGDYTIPDSVTTIGNGAFYGCENLTSINIPSSVTSIGEIAFYECSNLASVDIPDSVTRIGENAFYDCKGLTSINYTGTEEQWNAISKGAGWNNRCPSDMVINYNYQG